MKIYTNGNFGYECPLVEVETDLREGLPATDIIGLADNEVLETKERIKTVFKNCGLDFPQKRVLMSLSPCDLYKVGGRYDLTIALSILAESHKEEIAKDVSLFTVGELELSGDIRLVSAVEGGLANAHEKGVMYVILPRNTSESIPNGMKVYYATSLTDAYLAMKSIGKENETAFFKEINRIETTGKVEFYATTKKENLDSLSPNEEQKDSWNFLKYAMAVSVAGHHNIITVGDVDCDKTLVMNHFPNLLPKLMDLEQFQNEKIYSLAGLVGKYYDKSKRPFRMPHQTASIERMCGGGVNLRPGETTLANNGVLFLDESAEFRTSVLQMLRVPLENRSIMLSRAGRSTVFPANFILAMATNPCPCGNFGSKNKVCLCSASAVEQYWKKFSAPLLDRVAVRVDMNNVPKDFANYSQDELRAKIKRVWEAQMARELPRFNNDLNEAEIENLAHKITEKAKTLFSDTVKNENLTHRQSDYILKLARTVADMEGHEEIQLEDMQISIKFNSGFSDILK